MGDQPTVHANATAASGEVTLSLARTARIWLRTAASDTTEAVAMTATRWHCASAASAARSLERP